MLFYDLVEVINWTEAPVIEREIDTKLNDFNELGIPGYVSRETEIRVAPSMVSTLIGARRSGKSYRTLQMAAEMIRDKQIESLRNVCAIDFDNPVLATMAATDLSLIQKTFLKRNPAFSLKTPCLFIFDEIHKIAGWENYVIDLSRNPHWQVVVTGSSSKLLHTDVATELRGKSITTSIYPLTFKEYLRFKGERRDLSSTTGGAAALRCFDEYLRWGAFPAICSTAERFRDALLRQYFDTMILRDVVQRSRVANPGPCIAALTHLVSNMAKPFTLSSVLSFVKESGFNVGRESVADFVRWAEDAWLLFSVPVFSGSAKHQQRNPKKAYCIDWGLAHSNSTVWDGGYSRALENAVFVHLRRRFDRITYYLTRAERREVDFIACDSHGTPRLAAQVCQDLRDADTYKREVEPLAATARFFGLAEGLIVTLNEERLISHEGVSIRVVPAWRWMEES